MARFLLEHEVCVLATSAGDAPHASLMSYAVWPGNGYIVMSTPASTRKWSNLAANPRVSLLVDERERSGLLGRGGIRAMTVGGVHEPMVDAAERREAFALLAARHPHLGLFFETPGMEIIRVSPLELLLLTGATRAERIILKKE
jgi:nitroimidazol reductase NimA-like FMN-containing flavoprotein (pyridoxamine 5'-phosphate oxidase superfamily)